MSQLATKYTPSIGIECHVQLKTKTKLFAAVGNDARKAPPNTLISHICVGMPGALPVLNEAALELAVRAAFALNTKPQAFSRFDRKHYFYPDLPKGYQITQYEQPIINGGYLEFSSEGEPKRVRVDRVNLEEDAGKNLHPAGADYSLVDLNRAGTPLLEIVSHPDIHSATDAKTYARELWLLMKYAGVSDGDLYHGHVRFDVNVSLSSDSSNLGTRSEVKNLNSFKSVEATVDYEIKRQTELLNRGQKVVQETRGWDEAKQKTTSQREKEEAHDYRYMPEPDIPPIELNDSYIKNIEKDMPPLPSYFRQKLSPLNLAPLLVEDLLLRPETLRRVVEVQEKSGPGYASKEVFWSLGGFTKADEDDAPQDIEEIVDSDRIIELAKMVETGQLNSNAAQKVRDRLSKTTQSPIQIAQNLNLLQLSDEAEIEKIVHEVLEQNPKAANDVKTGQHKAIGFLVGQVMKASGGRANPSKVQEIIKKQLGIL